MHDKSSRPPEYSLRIITFLILTLFIIFSISGIAAAHAGEPHSGATPTESIGNVIFQILVLAFIVGGFVLSLIFYSIYKFREGNKHERKPQVTENKRLEIVWTVIPIIIICYLAIISTQALIVVDDPPGDDEALVIKVIGHQWFWEFVYPDGNISINELHIEEGQLVVFKLTSADVIHSFSLPEFYLKKDAFPGEITKAWIKAEPAGRYTVYCAEFCGSAHDSMIAEVVIFKPEDGRKPYGTPYDTTDPEIPSGETSDVTDHYYTPPSENKEIYLYIFILIVIIVIITLAFAFRPMPDGETEAEAETEAEMGSKDAEDAEDAEMRKEATPNTERRAPGPESREAEGDE